MLKNTERGKAKNIALYPFLLAAFSCVLGLSFCLIKSPQSQSRAYLGLAIAAMNNNQVEEATVAALESVRLNPSSPKGWEILSKMLQQKGQYRSAQQAMNIAGKLQHNEPVYALPAEFKLSLLAESGTLVP